MSHSHRSAAASRGHVQHDEAHHAEPTARRWPADDPEELAAQLRHQLDRLEAAGDREESDDALRLATAYLEHAQTLAWRAVGRGDFDAPRTLLDSLLTAHSFFDDHFPDLPPPARAAVEIYATFHAFYVASEALEELRTRARLADRRQSKTERAVLRVLAASPGRYLRRGEVHAQLDLQPKSTVARVGQVLVKLYHEGLLLSVQGPAQGNPATAFYALSGLGTEVVGSLHFEAAAKSAVGGSGDPPAWLGLLNRLAAVMTDQDQPSFARRIAAGALANIPEQASSALDPEEFARWIERYAVDDATKRLIESIRKTYLFRLMNQFSMAREASTEAELRFLRDLLRAIRDVLEPSPASTNVSIRRPRP